MLDIDDRSRRAVFVAGFGAALLLTGCAGSTGEGSGSEAEADEEKGGEKEVAANEDLMREHGVLRRALLVYEACAVRLRQDPRSVAPAALNRTARLFRNFGEDYHERRLEEPFIFPVVRQASGPAAALPDILLQQHQRGREITDYVLATTKGGAIATGAAEPLARALDGMDLMYRHHTAREDTVVFPAWKAALSDNQYKAMGDRFEAIERQQFGHDGFEDAVRQMAEIERSLGLADLAQFTAPRPSA